VKVGRHYDRVLGDENPQMSKGKMDPYQKREKGTVHLVALWVKHCRQSRKRNQLQALPGLNKDSVERAPLQVTLFEKEKQTETAPQSKVLESGKLWKLRSK